MNLGRVGVWLGPIHFRPAAEAREAAAEIEALGYPTLWIGEGATTKEVFSHAAFLLAATERLVVATGIASIWARDPLAMATGALTLGEAFPGRFLLGLGVSHAPLVSLRGQQYDRPLSRMRAYLDEMDAHEADYDVPAAAAPVPRVIGGLRPRMLELAAELTDGAHPYFVPVEHTVRAREILGPGKLLLPELPVLLETDPATAREVAREHATFYLQAANYLANLRSLGWDDADFANGGSAGLLDSIVAWGDEDAVAARIRAHLDAGADHVAIQPAPAGRATLGLEHLRRLAPVVAELNRSG